MVREVCPHHPYDDVAGTFVSDDVGFQFVCDLRGHPAGDQPWAWTSAAVDADDRSHAMFAAELGLAHVLPELLEPFRGWWVEYGVVERAYAVAHPADWAVLVERFGHAAIARRQQRYTASTFLGMVLGRLARDGAVTYVAGRATGDWSPHATTSWWALPPAPDPSAKASWEATGATLDYVPGHTTV